MSDPYLGQIMQGCWNFAPRGWRMCDGSLLPINQFNALFALLGTNFGGNGSSNFGIPNLAGRSMVGSGRSTTGTIYDLAETGGVEQVQLLSTNMPIHTHTAVSNFSLSVNVADTKASLQTPAAGVVLGRPVDGAPGGTSVPEIYCPSGTTANLPLAGVNFAGSIVNSPAGGSLPFPTISPYLALTTVIALEGIYPTRN